MQRIDGRELVLLAASVWSGVIFAQSGPQPRGLQAYEGRYDYRDGLTLYMVASDQQLVAIVDQSKYLLRPAGVDVFLNPPGDSIPFVRDSAGRVVAFREYGEQFAKRSAQVSPAVRSLLQPREELREGGQVYRYTPPASLADGIRAGAASQSSFSTEIAAKLVRGVVDQTYADVHSLLIYRQGALLLEEYFYGFDRDRPHEMRSFTKSVIALLVGVAIDRGLLSPNDSALMRLGYRDVGNPDPRKARITVAHLLSNQSGLACNEYDKASPGKETNLFETDDWVRALFDVPMVADPGTVGNYCSGGFYAAGKIVERVVGKSLPEFAEEALFQPLGVRSEEWKWSFVLDRSHRNDFGQIFLRPRDMLKLGVLIQDRGTWRNRRVVSESWIDASIARRAVVDGSDYGFGIWHRWYDVRTGTGNQRVDTLMLSGNGGQKVFIVPSLDLIVVGTGNAFFVESPLNRMMTDVLLPSLLR